MQKSLSWADERPAFLRPQEFSGAEAAFRKLDAERLNPDVICVKEIAPMCVNAPDRTIKALY